MKCAVLFYFGTIFASLIVAWGIAIISAWWAGMAVLTVCYVLTAVRYCAEKLENHLWL